MMVYFSLNREWFVKEILACLQQQEKYFSQIIWSSSDVLKKIIVRAT